MLEQEDREYVLETFDAVSKRSPWVRKTLQRYRKMGKDRRVEFLKYLQFVAVEMDQLQNPWLVKVEFETGVWVNGFDIIVLFDYLNLPPLKNAA